jgi:hypothetical protein
VAALDERRQLLAQSRRVLAVQVDLVPHALDPEPHGLVGRTAVEIVDQSDECLSCHRTPLCMYMSHYMYMQAYMYM